uniref:Roc domain-containing protein n=1 Tax=Glossina austeni TaxID=7395 RepID=A0A1A9VXZ0_GLOAU
MIEDAKIPYIKCVLLGDGATGNSTYIKRYLTGVSSLSVDVHSLTFPTNKRDVIFNVWDRAGEEQFCGLRHGYYIQAECAIIMFDVTSHMTDNNTRYFDISSRLNYNLEKPFTWMAQKLLGDIILKVVHMSTLLSS